MKTASLAACAALFVTVAANAQSRPDFSGTWIPRAPDSSAPRGRTSSMSAGGGRAVLGGGGPVELRLTQTATTLTIERSLGSVVQKFAHTFDGAGNVNVNGRTTLKTKSWWDGATLVTEGTQSVTMASGDVITADLREVRSLLANGELVLETTRTTGGRSTSSKQMYTKKQ